MSTEKNSDLLKLILHLIIIGLFMIITYQVVAPFLFGFFWAVMVVITTWPMMIKVQERLFNKRLLSVLVMTLILSLFFIIPFMMVISSIAKNGSFLLELGRRLSQHEIPTFDWLEGLPLVGHELHAKWTELIDNDGSELMKQSQPYIGTVISWSIEQVANIGTFVFHCAVMVIFSALLYFKGEEVKKYIYLLAHRISKQYGENTLTLAGQSIRAVALGVVVTAVTLTIIGGLSLVLTDMPFPGVITLLLFVCCVAQIGPVLVMLPCIFWQFYDGNVVSGIILVVVTVILTTLDSVMRTVLIKKGVDLPFLLIFFGVIGGLLGFGAMGLFIGPVILAVSYNLICVWIAEQD